MPNLIRILFLLLISMSSYGQMTDAALASQLSNLVPNNTSKLITPANVRKVIQDGYNSKISLYGSNAILGKLTYSSLYPISGDGDLTHKKYVDDKFAAVDLSSKENTLGNPSTNGYILASTTAGVRSWVPASSGSGTVTSVSSGSLSPLFSTSVATNTTTPALSFTQMSQAANRVFAGPVSGGDAAPTFRSLVETDIPTLSDSKISSASSWNAKIGGTGTLNQIPYFSATNDLTSSNKLRITGGDDFPYLWVQGTHSPLIFAYSSSTDNTGTAGITASVNGFSLFQIKAFGTADNTEEFAGFARGGNQIIQSSGDLALLPNNSSGTLWLGYGDAKVNDSFFHITVPTKIDNLANTTSSVVVANSTGVLSTARRARSLSVNTVSQTSDGPFLPYSMPAGTLTTNGDALVITYAGDKTSTTAGTVELVIGATIVAKASVSGTGLQQMPFQAVVTRTSDTEVSISCIKGDVLTATSILTVSSLTSNTLNVSINTSGGLTSRSAKINLEPAP